jgi:BES1/BZR1 plant transcription factor, N-terminal
MVANEVDTNPKLRLRLPAAAASTALLPAPPAGIRLRLLHPPPHLRPVGGRGRERKRKSEPSLERHRRAITSRMLSGLRQHDKIPLTCWADMNDVFAALAQEAGWIFDADGTAYRPTALGPTAGVSPPMSSSNHLVIWFLNLI